MDFKEVLQRALDKGAKRLSFQVQSEEREPLDMLMMLPPHHQPAWIVEVFKERERERERGGGVGKETENPSLVHCGNQNSS